MSSIPPESSKANVEMHFWQKAETMRPLAALVLAIGATLAVGAAATGALPFLPFAATAIAVDTTLLLSITIPLVVGGLLIGACALYPLLKSYPEKSAETQPTPIPPPAQPTQDPKPSQKSDSDPVPPPQQSEPYPKFVPLDPNSNLPQRAIDAAQNALPEETSDSEFFVQQTSEHEVEQQPENYEIVEKLKEYIGLPKLTFSENVRAGRKSVQFERQKESFVRTINSCVEGLAKGNVTFQQTMTQAEKTFEGEFTHPTQFGAILDFAQEQLEAFNAQLTAEKANDETLEIDPIDIEAFMEKLSPYRRAASSWTQLLLMEQKAVLDESDIDALREMNEVPEPFQQHFVNLVGEISKKPIPDDIEELETTLDALKAALNQDFPQILRLSDFAEKFQNDLIAYVQRMQLDAVSIEGRLQIISSIQQHIATQEKGFAEVYKIEITKASEYFKDLELAKTLLQQVHTLLENGSKIEEKITRIETFSKNLPEAKADFWSKYGKIKEWLAGYFLQLFDEGQFANYQFYTSPPIQSDGIDHDRDPELKEKLSQAIITCCACLDIDDAPEISITNNEVDLANDAVQQANLEYQEVAKNCSDQFNGDTSAKDIVLQLISHLSQMQDEYGQPILSNPTKQFAYLFGVLTEIGKINGEASSEIHNALQLAGITNITP